MYILSLDTTAKTVTVCVAAEEAGRVLPVSRSTLCGRLTHSETLLPMIDECLSRAGLTIRDVGMLALTAGPGSFTGVRIGASCVKGLSFSLQSAGVKHLCVGVSALEALAQNASAYSGYITCPVMDARRSQFYHAYFRNRAEVPQRLSEDRLLTAKEMFEDVCASYAGKKLLLVGDGAEACRALFDRIGEGKAPFSYRVCRAADLYQDAFSVALVAYRHRKEGKDSAKELSPLYLRASQAERERLAKEAK